jgi:hypothetical protein
MPLIGKFAPELVILQSVIPILSFPLAPVVVLIKIVPVVAPVPDPNTLQKRTVSLEASLINLTVDAPAVAEVFSIVNTIGPVPPALPSIITLLPPLKSIIDEVVDEPLIELVATPLAGIMVMVLVVEPPLLVNDGITIGYDTTVYVVL